MSSPRVAPVFLVALALLVVACNPDSIGSPTTGSTPDRTTSTTTVSTTTAAATTTQPNPSPRHRIGVRVVDGVGEFYDTETGERFTPRGMNYNRWVTPYLGGGIADDVLTVDHYDPATVDADFTEMEALGFNTVRILIDNCAPASGCSGTGRTGKQVNAAYLDNLSDFLGIARKHGLVVLVGSNTLPDDSWWVNETARLQDDMFEGSANEFLNPRSVPLYVDYWRQLVQGLVDRGAPTDNVLGYELRQEHHFWLTDAPLRLDEGLVTTVNGETYDMSDPEDKDRMIDEGLVYWADLLRDEIRSIDPTALVTVGFFTPNYPNQVNGPDEKRLVRTEYFLRHSSADFVDLHHYPGNGVDDADLWENFGIAGAEEMPILLGEFGAIRPWWSSAAAGAAGVMTLEVEACRVGFDGFLVWAWRGDLSNDIWWASEGAGEIAQVVAPLNRPDPCEFGEFDFVRFNVALDAVATASTETLGAEAEKVNDGKPDHWNSTEKAPQWIQLDLASPSTLDRIELVVAQNPPGRSVHELWIQVVGGSVELVNVFDAVTNDGDVLVYEPEEPLVDVEVVRVVTKVLDHGLAPAWREIVLNSPLPRN